MAFIIESAMGHIAVVKGERDAVCKTALALAQRGGAPVSVHSSTDERYVTYFPDGTDSERNYTYNAL